jgi:hypothetical protein
VLFTMGLSSFKTVATAIILIASIAVTTAALTQHAAEAQAQAPAPRPKTAAETAYHAFVEAQDPATPQPRPARDGERGSSPSPSIDADLVRRVRAPIVRAIPVSKDCMILSYIADWAHGNVDNIGVANNHGGVRTLIDWPEIALDVAPAPDRRFLLAIYARTTTSHPPAGPIHAFAIGEDWPELTSWKTQPAYHPEPAATYPFEPGPGWKVFDVTPIVRDRARAGRKGHGVLIRFLSENFSEGGAVADWSGYQFVSREGTGEWASRRPVLLVVEASKSGPARAESSVASGTTRSVEKIEIASKPQRSRPVDPALVDRAPGPIVRSELVSKDCMVLSYIPDWAHGNVDNIGIGNNDGGVRTLIDWPRIPVDEARSPGRRFLLALYSRQTISHPPAGAIHAHAILEDWPEITSWKTQPPYASKPAATYPFEASEGWKLFDITPIVREQARAGRRGHGIVLRFPREDFSAGPDETFSDYKLVSREGSGEWANSRPVLLVVEAKEAEKGTTD